ncbi:BCCT family transporter, partial [Acinetobacter baumannii]
MPATPISIIWGAALGGISLALLLIAGQDALSGLQSIMVSCSLPFAFILIGVMVAWGKDLARDPLMLRRNYATAAIARGVQHGL